MILLFLGSLLLIIFGVAVHEVGSLMFGSVILGMWITVVIFHQVSEGEKDRPVAPPEFGDSVYPIQSVNGLIDFVMYDSFSVDMKPNENITSMCYHSGELFIGTSLGRVIIYDVKEKVK